jgi:hypothetical protein
LEGSETMATSTAVKRKYNEKTYTEYRAPLRNEVYTEVEKLREESGLSKAEFLKMLVNEKYGINL